MFSLCPPANDRWNPWPFLRRFWDAAVALKTEFTVMLEPDNVLHRGFLYEPPFDAGGLEDANPHLGGGTVDYAEFMGECGCSRLHWMDETICDWRVRWDKCWVDTDILCVCMQVASTAKTFSSTTRDQGSREDRTFVHRRS